MNLHALRGTMLLLIFIWAGMLLGISFLEAPLKFQAPNITLALGVGIGRLVFAALNKVEIVFSISLTLLCIFTGPSVTLMSFLGVVATILIVQSFWLLPSLDARAQIIIDGGLPTANSPHLFYIAGEIAKLICLILAGLKLFSESMKVNTGR